MNNWISSLIDNHIQCWGCPVFDRLFQVISNAAATIYEDFSKICLLLFCILFTVFVVNAVWKNMRDNYADGLFSKSVQRVFINSIVALGLLGMGVALPRMITTITFEPVAQITMLYTQSMINLDVDQVNERVTYQPMEMVDNGFYRPELRDKIIMLMKTTITQFQSYMKLGVAIMDKAFSWDALLGVGSLVKHIILFFIGFYVAYGFLRLFFRYCCYFADAIIAMAFFAFFFPLSLITMAFSGADYVPKWITGIGGTVGVKQIKNLINSIVTLGSVIITYTVIMVIMAKFFSAPDTSVTDLMIAITTGEIFAADLNTENLQAMTIISCVVLIYVLDFIYKQIPQITKMILDAFGVAEKKDYSEQLANDVMNLTKKAFDKTVDVAKIVADGGKKESK